MKRFIIKGETASKKNNKQVFVRGGKVIVTTSQRYKAWEEAAILQFNGQKKNEYFEECRIVITFYYGTLREKDADNGTSSLFDTLKKVNIIKDDNWKIVRDHFVFSKYDKGNPRAEIEIYGIGEPIDINSRIILNETVIPDPPKKQELKQLTFDFD